MAAQTKRIEHPTSGEVLHGALQSYLRAIGRIPLLTAAREVALAQQIERGDKAAVTTLVEANLRLVVSIARRYQGRGLPLEDVIAEGNVGLWDAAEKYEWQRGYRFSTYATWWVKLAIRRALIQTGGPIRVPTHLHEALTQHRATVAALTTTLGRDPTVQEVEALIGPIASTSTLSAALHAMQAVVSLDQPVGEQQEHTLGTALVAGDGATAEDEALEGLAYREIRRMLETALTEQERLVLTLRFGLDGSPSRTLVEVGQCLGVTRERVRQIERRGRRKARRLLLATQDDDAATLPSHPSPAVVRRSLSKLTGGGSC